ncbi:MAG: ACP S-malonyltransferase [Candidatus Latescibacterota bacterium]
MLRCALLFPGQASQYVGMGQDLYAASQAARAVFEEADEVLGFPLSTRCFQGPEEDLRQTAVTQPAVFVHSMAAWRVLAQAGVEPLYLGGHSLGEYSALVAAGALDLRTGLALVRRRGEAMQRSGDQCPGSMLAVLGLSDAQVEEVCGLADCGGVVVPANYNAPGQVVISGERHAVARAGELARRAGAARVVELATSGAFHSPLMEPAAQEMAGVLREVRLSRARVPVVANVSARLVQEPEEIRQSLIDQITRPVLWTGSVQQLARLGVRTALEVGPGAVLKGLVRRIAREVEVHLAGRAAEVEAALAALGLRAPSTAG